MMAVVALALPARAETCSTGASGATNSGYVTTATVIHSTNCSPYCSYTNGDLIQFTVPSGAAGPVQPTNSLWTAGSLDKGIDMLTLRTPVHMPSGKYATFVLPNNFWCPNTNTPGYTPGPSASESDMASTNFNSYLNSLRELFDPVAHSWRLHNQYDWRDNVYEKLKEQLKSPLKAAPWPKPPGLEPKSGAPNPPWMDQWFPQPDFRPPSPVVSPTFPRPWEVYPFMSTGMPRGDSGNNGTNGWSVEDGDELFVSYHTPTTNTATPWLLVQSDLNAGTATPRSCDTLPAGKKMAIYRANCNTNNPGMELLRAHTSAVELQCVSNAGWTVSITCPDGHDHAATSELMRGEPTDFCNGDIIAFTDSNGTGESEWTMMCTLKSQGPTTNDYNGILYAAPGQSRAVWTLSRNETTGAIGATRHPLRALRSDMTYTISCGNNYDHGDINVGASFCNGDYLTVAFTNVHDSFSSETEVVECVGTWTGDSGWRSNIVNFTMMAHCRESRFYLSHDSGDGGAKVWRNMEKPAYSGAASPYMSYGYWPLYLYGQYSEPYSEVQCDNGLYHDLGNQYHIEICNGDRLVFGYPEEGEWAQYETQVIGFNVVGENALVTGKTLGSTRNNYGGYVGMRVVVGDKPIAVSQIGRLVVSGNTGSHTLKIAGGDGSFITGASVSVDTTGGTAGNFKYGSFPNPIELPAYSTNYIVSYETYNGDNWYDYNTTVTLGSAISEVAATYGTGGGSWTIPPSPSGKAYGPVDVKYGVVYGEEGTPDDDGSWDPEEGPITFAYYYMWLYTYGSYIDVGAWIGTGAWPFLIFPPPLEEE